MFQKDFIVSVPKSKVKFTKLMEYDSILSSLTFEQIFLRQT